VRRQRRLRRAARIRAMKLAAKTLSTPRKPPRSAGSLELGNTFAGSAAAVGPEPELPAVVAEGFDAQVQQLLLNAALAGFEGAPWWRLADWLRRYAYDVIRKWIRSGEIFARVYRRRLGTLASFRPPPDECDALAGETIAAALDYYRRMVLPGGAWHADRGASLRTFFIGQCLYQFRDIWRQWINDNGLADPKAVDLTDLEHVATGLDPFALTVLRRFFSGLHTWTGEHIENMCAAGFDLPDIAQISGLAVNALKSRLSRHRGARRAGTRIRPMKLAA
jgi:DNA-directed RNA polymerase specialized sigma24 family protein